MRNIPSQFAIDSDLAARGVPAPAESFDGATRTCVWESPQELAKWTLEKVGAKTLDGEFNKRDSWAGGWNMADSAKYALDGWIEGAAKLKESRALADAAIQSTQEQQTTRHDVAGSFVDVGAFVSGQPECMVEFVQAEAPIQRCRIVVDAFISSGVSSELVQARGKVIAAAALALQSLGIIVEVSIRMRYRHPDKRNEIIDTMVHVWKSGRTFDPAILAASLAHTGFIRRLFFNAQWYAGRNTSTYIASGGDNKFHDIKPEPGDVMVDGMVLDRHPWTDPDTMQRFMDKCLRSVGRSADAQINNG